METERSLTLHQPVKPLVNPDEAVKLWNQFEDMKRKLLILVEKENSDYQRIYVNEKNDDGQYHRVPRDFIKKSGFRKFAMFFGISDEIVEEVREEMEGNEFLWRMKVKAIAANRLKMAGTAGWEVPIYRSGRK